MLIVPELQTVVILTPRTGSRSLKNALLHKYPQAFLLYRHMEADGIPFGYDRWRRVGVVRNPLDRLWSLYKFLKDFGHQWKPGDYDSYCRAMRESVTVPFETWLMKNDLPFTTPHDVDGLSYYQPGNCVHHPIPENRKSQFIYLRPDLGTEIVRYDALDGLLDSFGIADIMLRQNATDVSVVPSLSDQAVDYLNRQFSWDFLASSTGVVT